MIPKIISTLGFSARSLLRVNIVNGAQLSKVNLLEIKTGHVKPRSKTFGADDGGSPGSHGASLVTLYGVNLCLLLATVATPYIPGENPPFSPSGNPLRGNLPLVAAKQELLYSSVKGMCLYNTIRAFEHKSTNNLI